MLLQQRASAAGASAASAPSRGRTSTAAAPHGKRRGGKEEEEEEEAHGEGDLSAPAVLINPALEAAGLALRLAGCEGGAPLAAPTGAPAPFAVPGVPALGSGAVGGGKESARSSVTHSPQPLTREQIKTACLQRQREGAAA